MYILFILLATFLFIANAHFIILVIFFIVIVIVYLRHLCHLTTATMIKSSRNIPELNRMYV